MTEFEKITPQGFFPTHVWVQDLKPEVYEPLNRQVMKDLNEMTAPRPQLRPGQNWQTEQNLHEFEEFDALIKLFRASSETVLEEMGLEYGGVEITGFGVGRSQSVDEHRDFVIGQLASPCRMFHGGFSVADLFQPASRQHPKWMFHYPEDWPGFPSTPSLFNGVTQ